MFEDLRENNYQENIRDLLSLLRAMPNKLEMCILQLQTDLSKTLAKEIQELEFFKSFLKDVVDRDHLDEDDGLNVLSAHIIHLAYRIDYIIDSLLARPSSLWHRLLDDVILEAISL